MKPAATPWLRMRQICLVAHQLEPVVQNLCDLLGLQVCHRDAGVERFGLHNALMRLGTRFIEVVAPLPGPRGQNTAATRHLARLGGDGGYMVILDTDAIAPWRERAAAMGIREASIHQVAQYTGLQLHPRDTGGTLLEINHSVGNAALEGPYWPAGPDWFTAPDSTFGATLQQVTLTDPDAKRLSERWSQLLDRASEVNAETQDQCLVLDDQTSILFRVAAGAASGARQGVTVTERLNPTSGLSAGPGSIGLTGLTVQVRDMEKVILAAQALKLAVRPASVGSVDAVVVNYAGIDWTLHPLK